MPPPELNRENGKEEGGENRGAAMKLRQEWHDLPPKKNEEPAARTTTTKKMTPTIPHFAFR